MTRTRRLLASLTTIAVAGLIASPTFAGIEGDALTIVATSQSGDYATVNIPVPQGPPPWVWESDELVEMRSELTGDLIAVMNPEGRESRVEYIDDPIIGLIFAVQAGPVPTQFIIASGLLLFPTMSAEGRATAGYSLTDFDGDGASLDGIGDPAGAGGAYLAQYNGFALTLSGTTFAEFIPSMSAGSFSSSTVNDALPALGFLPIVDPVSDMSVLISFELSANDLASGTTNYIIQEKPTSIESVSWGGVKGLYR
jgi:hypothetical protein